VGQEGFEDVITLTVSRAGQLSPREGAPPGEGIVAPGFMEVEGGGDVILGLASPVGFLRCDARSEEH